MPRPARGLRAGRHAHPPRGALSAPRVPSTEPARRWVWIALAIPTLFAAREPRAPAPWRVVVEGPGCQLVATARMASAPCPCERWPGRVRLALGLPLDPNRAAPAELEALPGLGPARAGAIAAERASRGPYRDLPEIAARVRGIGPATLEQISPHLSLAPCAAGPPPPGR